jgi:hypothetical protein
MGTKLQLSEIQWVFRASARIRELDPLIPLADSVDLAAAIAQRPSYRHETPETAVEMLFVQEGHDIFGSRWAA